MGGYANIKIFRSESPLGEMDDLSFLAGSGSMMPDQERVAAGVSPTRGKNPGGVRPWAGHRDVTDSREEI
jgi:hypothetical protein